ncbi:hypothetical protein CYY_008437 [Polysphondylium violaceum]|uniref:Uncharacterized protein n=1 Tax=Polysphondylium violaceum TaxID=133409 RepID=A0A8J4PV79_9MYCE|nr:hypothetical protein CYY_008437 [Polysphondylium violaceum]
MSIKYLLVLVLVLTTLLAVANSIDTPVEAEVTVTDSGEAQGNVGLKSFCYEIGHVACLLHELTDKQCVWYGNKCRPY